jgi:hypothetical protein
MMLALRFGKSPTMARQSRMAFSIIGDSTTFRGIRKSEYSYPNLSVQLKKTGANWFNANVFE